MTNNTNTTQTVSLPTFDTLGRADIIDASNVDDYVRQIQADSSRSGFRYFGTVLVFAAWMGLERHAEEVKDGQKPESDTSYGYRFAALIGRSESYGKVLPLAARLVESGMATPYGKPIEVERWTRFVQSGSAKGLSAAVDKKDRRALDVALGLKSPLPGAEPEKDTRKPRPEKDEDVTVDETVRAAAVAIVAALKVIETAGVDAASLFWSAVGDAYDASVALAAGAEDLVAEVA